MNLKVMSRRIKKLNRNENTKKWKGIKFDLFVSEPNLVYFHFDFLFFQQTNLPFQI
jgi:hypothetical protein